MKRTGIILLAIAVLTTAVLGTGFSLAAEVVPTNNPRAMEATVIFSELMGVWHYPDFPDYFGGSYLGNDDGTGEKFYIYFHDIPDDEFQRYKDALKDYEDAVVFGESKYSYNFVYDYAMEVGKLLRSKGYFLTGFGPLDPDAIQIYLVWENKKEHDKVSKDVREIVDAYAAEKGVDIKCILTMRTEGGRRNAENAEVKTFPTIPVIIGAGVVVVAAAVVTTLVIRKKKSKAQLT